MAVVRSLIPDSHLFIQRFTHHDVTGVTCDVLASMKYKLDSKFGRTELLY